MQQLPKVSSLRDAVQTVISSNKKDGYPPTRFIQMTSVNDAELTGVCSKVIMKPESLTALYMAICGNHPELLTIEDFVAVYGEAWGFHTDIIKEAQRRKNQFDEWAKCTRYIQ
ncbi:hypothetical protein NYE33_33575 [Paenibacillus sp. FSL R10-2199]|uniref:hypothetical protein n=1 Tax=Paenibacillus sp. FSL R10-2199 TaxID=2975348 RepID=UPI0030F85AFA